MPRASPAFGEWTIVAVGGVAVTVVRRRAPYESQSDRNVGAQRDGGVRAQREVDGAIGLDGGDAAAGELEHELAAGVERDVGCAVAVDVQRAGLAARGRRAHVGVPFHAPQYRAEPGGRRGE